MDVRLTWTDWDKAGDYVVSDVLSPRDLVSRPDNMDETVLHTYKALDNDSRFAHLDLFLVYLPVGSKTLKHLLPLYVVGFVVFLVTKVVVVVCAVVSADE